MYDRRIFVRSQEFHFILITEDMRVLQILTMTDMNRIRQPADRLNRQVQGINRLTILIIRIHLGVIADRVIHTGRAQDAIVETINLAFPDVLVDMFM